MPMQRYKFESNSQLAAISQHHALRLFMPMQRYKFESNSQQVLKWWNSWWCCLCQCKDTNLKAIHNSGMSLANSLQVVYANAKIQIWKQFTTICKYITKADSLFMPMQRYKFESNSQPNIAQGGSVQCCLCQCKDTNLKAIHNNIWLYSSLCWLFMPMQRYKFESNSQQVAPRLWWSVGCLCQCKDTNLKAIHNKPPSNIY